MKTSTNRFSVYHLNEYPCKTRTLPKFANSAYTLVAVVEACDLDHVFRLTNNIHQSWQANPEVKWNMGPEYGRSTSVGDVICDPDGKFFRCVSIGWEEIS